MWTFESSYKHMFWYYNDAEGITVCIMGDTYRDNFEPTMADNTMEYFKNLEGVEVMEVETSA